MTGVALKTAVALDETKGDIDKSIEFLRKKNCKASKMSRTQGSVIKEDSSQIHN